MGRIFISLFLLIVASSLYSAEPVIKFYEDGQLISEYNISDIEEMTFLPGDKVSAMLLFYRYKKPDIYNTDSIMKITFPIIEMGPDSIDVWMEIQLSEFVTRGNNVNNIDSILFIAGTEKTSFREVTIGSQIWMADNLDVMTYRNGDTIQYVSDLRAWDTLSTGAWCYYDNDPVNGLFYGKLYNWYAVHDPRGLAPDGWHIPSDDEWKTLELELGMSQEDVDIEITGYRGTNEGAKLAGKSFLWYDGLGDMTENSAFGSSGFNAVPGGIVNHAYGGDFQSINKYAFWWTSTNKLGKYPIIRSIGYQNPSIKRSVEGSTHKQNAYSVRCVKD